MTKEELKQYEYTLKLKNSSFVIDESSLIRNLSVLKKFEKDAGIQIIFALKGFATWKIFPLIRQYFKDASCSSLNEFKLTQEYLHGNPHAYFVAYKEEEYDFIASQVKTLTFNSITQLQYYSSQLENYNSCSFGIRINPEVDLIDTPLYNPCSPNSRLGITKQNLEEYLDSIGSVGLPPFISGLLLHGLCEDRGEGFCALLDTFEGRFQDYIQDIKWLNLGGGHLITSSDYNQQLVINRIQAFKKRYPATSIYIEPSSAFAWQAGVLAVKIIDIVQSGDEKTLIIDASFSCHTPDCLEMPYRPKAILVPREPVDNKPESNSSWEGAIGGITCLAGDTISGFSFDKVPKVGDSIVFDDMLHYTMVKTTFFNGINHPSVMIKKTDGSVEELKTYDYLDYKNSL